MISFPLFLFILGLVALVCAAAGYAYGHNHGNDSGFDEGYEFATSQAEVAWRLEAWCEAALDAARQPLAELSIHPKFSKSPTPQTDDR